MIKGLEELNRIRVGCLTVWDFENATDVIEKELKRLAKIDDLLEEIGIDENDLPIWFEMQKQDGKRLVELEKAFDTLSKDDEKAKKLLSKEIEKNRAFEIIKNKQIDIWQLKLCMSFNLTMTKEEQLNEYNKRHATFLHLTQEEYDFLKEVLNNGR